MHLTQTLTLLLIDDTTARKIVAESDVITVLLDLLSRTLQGKTPESASKEESELPKWVATVLLTLDSLAQLPVTEAPELNVSYHCLLKYACGLL